MQSKIVSTFYDGQWEPDTVFVTKVNETYLRVTAESAIRQELYDYFAFYVPGYQHMPKFKARAWDGKLRLYNAHTGEMFHGLLPYLQRFAEERDYEFIDECSEPQEPMSIAEGEQFFDQLNIPEQFVQRDFQIKTFVHCVQERRATIVSPTASGKSLIIYLLTQWYREQPILIVVPTIALVHQMRTDFLDYGCDPDDIAIITGGMDKETTRHITISTWQSIYKQPAKYFAKWQVAIGDECHLFKAKCLQSVLTKMTNARYRFGFTGTLDGTQTHRLILEGLFGQAKQFVSTRELIDQEVLSDFEIKCLVLQYTKEERAAVCKKLDYQNELDFIVTHKQRNIFLRNLALSLKGNTLMLCQFVEKHGKILYEMISEKAKDDHKVFFVHGGTEVQLREKIRAIVEKEKHATIIASFKIFSTGTNIRNLHNVVFCSPSKSRVRVLQSIGRVLRRTGTKIMATLYDVADDLHTKSKINLTLQHFAQRIEIYNEEGFPYKIYNIKMGA